ncbi:MAG: Na/Pi cotransporter family protein [Bradyrhizobiaceae bacterium]|nr:MAG: Na/Pi cotransporter family protein [Bradyrhizobiaceae bacterium]
MLSGSVQRALGSNLRYLLSVGTRNRFQAFFVGLGVTALLQSSTATAMMLTSFAGSGVVDLVPSLAIMLGANVGTTLIVQIAAFDISLFSPITLLVGLVLFRRARRSDIRDMAQALIGLGLMLLALKLLTETMQPVEASALLRQILPSLTQDHFAAIILTAIVAWAAHSSLASMLFIMSLANTGTVDPISTLAMVLGANLGSALNPLFASLGENPSHLRLPVGNLLNRVIGCLLIWPFVGSISGLLGEWHLAPAPAAALFHLIFNLTLAVLSIGLLGPIARGLMFILPERPSVDDPATPQFLAESALKTPSVAVSNATREVLRMAGFVEAMLKGSRDSFHKDDRNNIENVKKLDDVVDRLFEAIQRYVVAIDSDASNKDDAARISQILAFVINLEHIGDIIVGNLMNTSAKRINSKIKFPSDVLAETDAMHSRVIGNLQLAISVFMFGDPDAARSLVAAKEHFREIERDMTQRHFAIMRKGILEEAEASSLLLDITRDVKRIEAHVAASAQNILEASGQLRSSRLRAL